MVVPVHGFTDPSYRNPTTARMTVSSSQTPLLHPSRHANRDSACEKSQKEEGTSLQMKTGLSSPSALLLLVLQKETDTDLPTWGWCLEEVALPDCIRVHAQPGSHMLNDVLHDDRGLKLAGGPHSRVGGPVGLAQLDLELEGWYSIGLHIQHSTARLAQPGAAVPPQLSYMQYSELQYLLASRGKETQGHLQRCTASSCPLQPCAQCSRTVY